MGKKIYVGNLPFTATSESLSEVFGKFGEVGSSKIITDRDTGRSKGFGFIEMSDSEAADSAIEKLNGSDLGGRALTVNEARPMEKREGGFGGGAGRSNSPRGGDRGGDRGDRGASRGGFGGGNRW
jgi:cold-inducible RNA-binding protein